MSAQVNEDKLSKDGTTNLIIEKKRDVIRNAKEISKPEDNNIILIVTKKQAINEDDDKEDVVIETLRNTQDMVEY